MRTKSDLPALIADDIREQIVHRLLAPGSKLPTEKEMGEQHGVSRVVVREAIARLRHEGLVTSHQGRGVFVASPEDGRFLSIDDQALSRPEDYQKLYDLRKILESGTAALAAIHRDRYDLDQMEREFARMAASDVDAETYVDADISFHRAIATASHNPFLVLFITFVDARLKESISLALSRLDFRKTIEISAIEHRTILDRIGRRDSEGARIAMQTHLENSSRRLGI
jgi:GntR family transcriptional regulator, transcriptional repressor for pyruvate dehydrogenase complex